MPLKYPDYQKSFEFLIATNGHPVANVITLGQGRWLTVCSLCGCAHDVTTFTGDVYTPNCIVKITHPAAYRPWLDRFPAAVQHSSVLLKSVELADLNKPAAPLQIVPAADFARREAGIDRAQRATKSKPKKTTRRKAKAA